MTDFGTVTAVPTGRRVCLFTVLVLLSVYLLVVPGMVGDVQARDDTSPVLSETTVEVNPIRKRSFYVGLYYPGLTLGYQGDRFSLELRGSSQDDIDLAGARFSHFVYPYRGGNLYWGLETYHVTYEDVIVEGNGTMTGLVGGFQTYLGTRLSFTIDGGPYYISLEDDVSGLQSDGLHFVVNTGVNIHF